MKKDVWMLYVHTRPSASDPKAPFSFRTQASTSRSIAYIVMYRLFSSVVVFEQSGLGIVYR